MRPSSSIGKSRCGRRAWRRRPWSIPAYAGEPTAPPACPPPCRVYPRVCGGTHYVKVWDQDGSFGLGVEDRAGNVLWTWFPADWIELDNRRRGILVYAADRDGE